MHQNLKNQTFCVLSNEAHQKLKFWENFAILRDSQSDSNLFSRSINAKAHVCQVLAFEP
jgi:hypothetical protein